MINTKITNNNAAQRIPIVWRPLLIILSLWGQRSLITQLVKREVAARYRGSYLGILWSFINPFCMLLVYTFVFGVIFKTRWTGNDSQAAFALLLFTGITTFNVFSEVIMRAPSLIVGNVNYVKKVVFPLEILPVVALGGSLVNVVISLLILMVGMVFVQGIIQWTIVFVPLVLLPLILLSLGLAWFLASLGVYLRDVGQIVGLGVQALMFLSPIFYPISAIPVALQPIYYVNPISYVVEDMRRIIIGGQLPNWEWLLMGTMIGMIIAILGYNWFQKTRGGFADVI